MIMAVEVGIKELRANLQRRISTRVKSGEDLVVTERGTTDSARDTTWRESSTARVS